MVDRQICSSPKSGEVDKHFCPPYSRWADLPLLRISLYCYFKVMCSGDVTHCKHWEGRKSCANVMVQPNILDGKGADIEVTTLQDGLKMLMIIMVL